MTSLLFLTRHTHRFLRFGFNVFTNFLLGENVKCQCQIGTMKPRLCKMHHFSQCPGSTLHTQNSEGDVDIICQTSWTCHLNLTFNIAITLQIYKIIFCTLKITTINALLPPFYHASVAINIQGNKCYVKERSIDQHCRNRKRLLRTKI